MRSCFGFKVQVLPIHPWLHTWLEEGRGKHLARINVIFPERFKEMCASCFVSFLAESRLYCDFQVSSSDFAVVTYQFLVGLECLKREIEFSTVCFFRVSMGTFRNHIFSLTQEFKFFQEDITLMTGQCLSKVIKAG